MRSGLMMTCPRVALTILQERLRGLGITVEERATSEDLPIQTGMVRKCFFWQRQDDRLVVHTLESDAYPGVLKVVIESPPVSRNIDFLLEIVGLLRECGGRDGPPERFRCSCGYNLIANVSGRCPECGALIPTPAASASNK